MGDEEQSVGPQSLGPFPRAVRGELGELGAQTGAAERERAARGAPRPVGEHGPFPERTGEGVERPGREGRDQPLAAEISLWRAPPVPWSLGPDDAEAGGAERISLVDQAAPMVELDANAVAVNESRRVDDARGLVDPCIDRVAQARRGLLKRNQYSGPTELPMERETSISGIGSGGATNGARFFNASP